MSSNPWTLKPQTGNFPEAIEAGNYPAILIALVDLGTQESEYKGVVSYRREIFLAWEIPGEKGAPVLGKAFSATLSAKSNLGKWLSALARDGKIPGDGINLLDLLGKPCLLQVSNEMKKNTEGQERTYNGLTTVSRLPKEMTAPKATRKPLVVNLDDKEIPDWLPRSYGHLLEEVRDQCAELHSTTRGKFEAWKKAPKKKAPQGPGGGGSDSNHDEGGYPDDSNEDEIPF
jgi:hypothetical protein